MKIGIIHSVSGESAKMLTDYLKEDGHIVTIHRPYKDDYPKKDFDGYDYVVSLGCSAETRYHKKRINTATAVAQCVDKRLSFASFDRAGIATVEWTTKKSSIPEYWDQVAVRKSASGRKAEDLEWYLLPLEMNLVPNDAELYTRCFYGMYEYRIIVLEGKIVGRYFKRTLADGSWEMVLHKPHGFENMDDHVLRAAKALGISYAGFDVLAKTKNDFVILEANSGATVTHEACVAFQELFSK